MRLYIFALGHNAATWHDSKFLKAQWQQGADAVDAINHVAATQQYVDGLATKFLIFQYGLAAHSTRCDRFFDKIPLLPCGNGQPHETHPRITGGSIKYGRPLGTRSGRERRILLIGPCDYFAIFEQQGSPHVELAIRNVCTGSGLLGHFYQLFLIFAQFIIRVNPYLCINNSFIHGFTVFMQR